MIAIAKIKVLDFAFSANIRMIEKLEICLAKHSKYYTLLDCAFQSTDRLSFARLSLQKHRSTVLCSAEPSKNTFKKHFRSRCTASNCALYDLTGAVRRLCESSIYIYIYIYIYNIYNIYRERERERYKYIYIYIIYIISLSLYINRYIYI